MKKALLLLSLIGLCGCPPPNDPPITLERRSGVQAISSVTVVAVRIDDTRGVAKGSLVKRALVKFLNENPRATIKQMEVTGYKGHPTDLVLIVEGKLGTSSASEE